jgi:MtN3 and saliva related transmembrane protein
MHILGYIAGCLTVSSSIPQVVRILRTRNVFAISLPLYCMLFSGVLLWLLYGISLRALPLILSNGTSLVLIGIILFLKIKLGRET